MNETMHMRLAPSRYRPLSVVLASIWLATACAEPPPADRVRASGQVEATDVQVSAQVAGRLVELRVTEGQRVEPGAVVAVLDTADAQLALARARADRDQAVAQLRLAEAGARPEDIRQSEALVAAAQADAAAADADLAASEADVRRFEQLLATSSGSRKQRDDAVTRRDVAGQRVQSARERVKAAEAAVARLMAGARREEVEVARTRVVAAGTQIAIWEKAIADATITAPVGGVVTQRVADVGELVVPRAPLLVITDLDHAWANVYVGEPDIPLLRVGRPATLHTDAGGDAIPGIVSQIADKAEFTPRNVQTADDRSKLVYRVKVTVDNASGVLKVGMPVEAEIPLER